ncbi:unnamed protein product [Absidia cylindrospora]
MLAHQSDQEKILINHFLQNDHWVLPKGGWEVNESQAQAALRETWEEAGIKGRITRPLGVFEEVNKRQVKAHHWIYEMEIDEVYKKFPEKKKRERRWYTYDEALIVVKGQYMKDAMMLSSLNPANQAKSVPHVQQQVHVTTLISPPSSVPVSNGPTTSPPTDQNKHMSFSHSLKTLFKKKSSL